MTQETNAKETVQIQPLALDGTVRTLLLNALIPLGASPGHVALALFEGEAIILANDSPTSQFVVWNWHPLQDFNLLASRSISWIDPSRDNIRRRRV